MTYLNWDLVQRTRPWGYNPFLCSTQLSMKFILLINVQMPTIVDILTLISKINITNEILRARNFFICRYFSFYERLKFHAQLSWAWKKFYNLAAWCHHNDVIFTSRNLLKLRMTAENWCQHNDVIFTCRDLFKQVYLSSTIWLTNIHHATFPRFTVQITKCAISHVDGDVREL